MKSWKKWAALALVAALAAGVLVKRMQPREVRAAELVRGPVLDAVYATGEVRAERRAEVSAELGGLVAGVMAEAGDTVGAEETLARIEKNSLELARSMAEEARKRARSALAEAEREASRRETLYRRKVVSQAEYESARRAAEQARADLARLEAALGIEEVRLGKTAVKTPMAGLVVARLVESGEYVSAGQKLFEVIDPASLLVIVDVDESEIARIEPGQAVTVALDAYPGERFSGKVARVIPKVDDVTRTAEVRVRLEEAPPGLHEGMSATVNIVTREIADALLAPRDAAVLTAEGARLWLVEDGRLKPVEFEPGASDAERIEVKSGPLSAGQTAALDPDEEFAEGMRVRVK